VKGSRSSQFEAEYIPEICIEEFKKTMETSILLCVSVHVCRLQVLFVVAITVLHFVCMQQHARNRSCNFSVWKAGVSGRDSNQESPE
jgi:hypothetical protein